MNGTTLIKLKEGEVTALIKEFGWKKALGITGFEIGFAILIGGVVYRILKIGLL